MIVRDKIYNCNYNGRRNQNTTIWFSTTGLRLSKDFVVSDNFILCNLHTLDKRAYLQFNTHVGKIEIH